MGNACAGNVSSFAAEKSHSVAERQLDELMVCRIDGTTVPCLAGEFAYFTLEALLPNPLIHPLRRIVLPQPNDISYCTGLQVESSRCRA